MRRFLDILLLTVATALLLLAFANTSGNRLEQMARSGKIDATAPVKASAEISINAPIDKVWSLLTGVQNWPKWQPDITRAGISGPVVSGAAFTWRTGGTAIKSRIALVQSPTQLVWTGTAFGAKAIHVWTLRLNPEGGTFVRTDESMNGVLLGLFYSSRQLQHADESWLKSLKAAAER